VRACVCVFSYTLLAVLRSVAR